MFGEFLERYNADLDATMREIVEAVEDAPPDLEIMLQYPMGWVDENGAEYTKPTGKRIRPILLLLCAESVGGDWHQALPAAAAVEILHNFSLVHDDIQDNSDIRHGRPTVWNQWGQPLAINIGDAMFALSYHALEQLSTKAILCETILDVWRIYNKTILELTRGQHLDMSFETRSIISVDEYTSMVRGKTATLVSASCQIGAKIGSGSALVANEYAKFGLNLGLAFQIRDDILGIWGTPDQTGKSIATDIIARKKSLPILYGLEKSEKLRQLYKSELFGQEQVQEAINLLDEVNAYTYTHQMETHYYETAISSLKNAQPQGEAGKQLIRLVERLFGREH